MLYAAIPNFRTLDLAEKGDIHFILAHRVFENEEYAKFYAAQSKYKMMDNGAYELNDSLTTKELLEAAEIVGADEIVAPDRPYVPDESYEMTKNFIEELVHSGKIGKMKIHAIPHGQDSFEYIEYFHKIRNLGPDVIGFSILDLWKWSDRLRPFIIHGLYYYDEMSSQIQYHLLGLDDPMELLLYSGIPIRSVDTSMPFSKAHEGEDLFGAPTSRIPDNAKLTSEQWVRAELNIGQMLDVCHRFGLRGRM